MYIWLISTGKIYFAQTTLGSYKETHTLFLCDIDKEGKFVELAGPGSQIKI